jgi:hypothetical protein
MFAGNMPTAAYEMSMKIRAQELHLAMFQRSQELIDQAEAEHPAWMLQCRSDWERWRDQHQALPVLQASAVDRW